jgi:predicted dehydrogenase
MMEFGRCESHLAEPSLPAQPMIAKPARIGPTKVGIVGLGRRAKLIARAASRSGKLRVIAAYSRSEQERRLFQLETRVPVVSDLKTLLSYPMLDGVIVTVPSDQQVSVSEEIAKAKKHIYMESPIAGTLEQGLEVLALERKYGITVTVGYSARFLPGILKMHEAIDAGDLGTISLLEANFSSPSGLELSGSDFHASEENVFGPLSQLALQQFDVLQHLGGEVVEISAMGAKLSPSNADVSDQSTALLKFLDGKLGYVGSSWTSPGVFSVRIFGSKGLLHYEADLDARDATGNAGANSTLYIQRGKDGYAKREELHPPESDAMGAALEIFAQACRSGKSSELSAAEVIRGMAVVAAASWSIANNSQTVRIADVLHRARSRAPELARA